MKTIKNNKGRILICVNEFFGAWGTPYGGYGFIARHLLPKALNKATLNFDVCLGRSKNCSLKKYFFMDQYITEEGVKLIRLPRVRALAANIVNSYDKLRKLLTYTYCQYGQFTDYPLTEVDHEKYNYIFNGL